MLALNYYICCFIIKSIHLIGIIFFHGLYTGLDYIFFISDLAFFLILEEGNIYAIQIMGR